MRRKPGQTRDIKEVRSEFAANSKSFFANSGAPNTDNVDPVLTAKRRAAEQREEKQRMREEELENWCDGF